MFYTSVYVLWLLEKLHKSLNGFMCKVDSTANKADFLVYDIKRL